ncbi:TPA: PD-(D/E)XK nuclease family protein [Streptococcus suis]|nr:PD-(D/E)XK nuclease family protein [Streptococcus suis]
MSKKKSVLEFVQCVEAIYDSTPELQERVALMLQDEETPNFWNIIEYGDTLDKNGKSAHETRYSKVLKWLLDPHASHKLGYSFLTKLLSKKRIDTTGLLSDTDKVECFNEYKNIDVYYYNKDKQVQVAIEVKQYSSEIIYGKGNKKENIVAGESQLTKYSRILAEREGKAYKFFLTPTGIEPIYDELNDNQSWSVLSYEDMIDIVEEMMAESQSDDFIKIANDFVHDFKKTISTVKFTEGAKITLQKKIANIEAELKSYFPAKHSENEYEMVDELQDHLLDLPYQERRKLEVILDCINTYRTIQQHVANEAVQKVVVRLAEAFTGVALQPDEFAPIKAELLRSDSIFKYVHRTRGKGQGLYFLEEKTNNSSSKKDVYVYCSGDTYGVFFNDGLHAKYNGDINAIEHYNFNYEDLSHANKKQLKNKKIALDFLEEQFDFYIKEINESLVHFTKRYQDRKNGKI